MRISSNQIFQNTLNGLRNQNASIARLMEQLNGKRVQSASDDPVLAARISLMTDRISNTQQLEHNRESAEGRLNFESSIITNIVELMHKFKEKQNQASNPMTDNDRKSIAEEVDALAKQLFQFANTKDSEGFYLFSGSKTLTQPFSRLSAGQYIYNGDNIQRFQDIGTGAYLALNDPGQHLFMEILNGNGDFSIQTGNNTGSSILETGLVVDRSALTKDTYTMQFALNSTNQLVVMVTGAAGGNILPPTGNVDDAPVYEKDMSVVFEGISIKVGGEPAAGDTYTIEPAKNESIFSTLDRMLANLLKPAVTASEKAFIGTENNQIMAQLDHAMEKMLGIQSSLGIRLNQLEVAGQVNQDLLLNSQQTLYAMQDIPLDEVIISLNTQMTFLQAAQQSFVRIQSLSAFNYLR